MQTPSPKANVAHTAGWGENVCDRPCRPSQRCSIGGGHGARADKELKLSFVGCGSIAIRSPISCFRLPTAPAAVAEAEDQLFVCVQMFDKIGGVRRPPGPSQTVPPGLGWGPNRLYVLFLIWIHMREIVNSFFKMDPYQNKIVNRFVDMDLDGLSVVL